MSIQPTTNAPRLPASSMKPAAVEQFSQTNAQPGQSSNIDSLDVFQPRVAVGSAHAAANGQLNEAAARRLDPAFESIVEEGNNRHEPGGNEPEGIGDPLRNAWTKRDGGIQPGADRREHEGEEEDDEPFDLSDPNRLRAERREALYSELTTPPDVSVRHDGEPEDRPAAPSSKGEASTTGGDSQEGRESNSIGGGATGHPLNGPVGELGGHSTDYSSFAEEGALLASRLSEMGDGGAEMGILTGRLVQRAGEQQGDTTPGVEADPATAVEATEIVRRVGTGGLGTAAVLGTTGVGSYMVTREAIEGLKAWGVDVDAAVQDKFLAISDAGKFEAEMEARAALVQAAAAQGLKTVVQDQAKQIGVGPGNSGQPQPGVSDPGADSDSLGGGRPGAADWEYRIWLMASTGRNPFGPGSGDVDPSDEGAPASVSGEVSPLLAGGSFGLFGQPVDSMDRAGIAGRESVTPHLLPGDRGDVDPGEDSDTGGWTREQRTEDEGDALDGFGGSGLSIGDLRRDDEEEDDDSGDDSDDGIV